MKSYGNLENAPESVLVHACTWNVASQVPNKAYLQKHFRTIFIDESDEENIPDIIVLGFQEIEMNAKALITEQTEASSVWRSILAEVLPDYDCIACHQLVGLCIFVWVQFKLARHCSPCLVSECREGFSRALGNKGSVSTRFKLFNKQFNFINVHLPAHTEKLLERNYALNSIINKAVNETSLIHNSTLQFHNSTNNNVSMTTNDDFVILIGDFNYRIDSDFNFAQVISKISQNRLSILHKCDQLQKEKRRGNILKGFHEAGPLDFIPTYKCKTYEPYEQSQIDFSNMNDIFATKKERIPSWCDRIFYRYNSRISIKSYTSEMSLITSDHKPVIAKMLLNISENFKEVSIPEVEVVQDLLNFDEVSSPTISEDVSPSTISEPSTTTQPPRKLPPLPKHLLDAKKNADPNVTKSISSTSQPRSLSPTKVAIGANKFNKQDVTLEVEQAEKRNSMRQHVPLPVEPPTRNNLGGDLNGNMIKSHSTPNFSQTASPSNLSTSTQGGFAALAARHKPNNAPSTTLTPPISTTNINRPVTINKLDMNTSFDSSGRTNRPNTFDGFGFNVEQPTMMVPSPSYRNSASVVPFATTSNAQQQVQQPSNNTTTSGSSEDWWLN